MKKPNKLTRSLRREAERQLRRGLQGPKYRWRHQSDAGRCAKCPHPPIGPVYRGSRWAPVRVGGSVGNIYHTDDLCVYHSAKEIHTNMVLYRYVIVDERDVKHIGKAHPQGVMYCGLAMEDMGDWFVLPPGTEPNCMACLKAWDLCAPREVKFHDDEYGTARRMEGFLADRERGGS